MKRFILTFSVFLLSFSFVACQKPNDDVLPTTENKEVNIRIMQYNIHFGVGTDGVYNINRVVEVIENAEADVIILNEVDKHYSDRSKNMDMAKYIAEKLDMNFVFKASIIIPSQSSKPDQEVGNAIITKGQIEHLGTLFFSEGDQWPRVITKCKVTFNDTTSIYVATSHYGLTESGRKTQAEETLVYLKDLENEPLIFAGDLNAQPESVPLGILTSRFTDAFAARNSFFTFPSTNPNRRIDYILGNDLITFSKNAKVIYTQASDHLPIVVDLTIKKQ